ncbi:family 43 glycosylhydrolase [Caldicellulosiruptor acetigenus]|uniref:family 43 glycosylhydrolase n=1 Tax=Caldicellulosiruptor acetigenus TaxID=301953 RepID=UPI0004043DFA|nr:family 43 glycosylhydrolase [Caldicellulosiruptor acetigenus]WAM36100.1 family 43 glycosylhydrolase [Caldicellulosiruptor acetigenus]
MIKEYLKKGKKMVIPVTFIICLILFAFVSSQINEVYSSYNLQGGSKLLQDNMIAYNPIILADIPDPDIIRVGNNYYMVSTTMHMTPGVPIMHSTDLVNWRIIGYVYDRLEDNDAHNLKNGMNIYGKGQWAPCIRYHKGKYYVLFGSLDTGKTYLFSSKNITGPWERVEFNEYLHDPSLLFDDDGKAYIIYGRTEIRIRELTPDYKAINPNGLNKVIIPSKKDGMEGSHAYKINGKYYITTIWWEKGSIRKQYIYRANKIDGPYEERLALSDTMGYKSNGVAQGGLIDTPDGKWFAMLFQDHDAVGRVPVLVPVRWENGWPIFGDENGKVPLKFIKPGKSSFESEVVKSDEFYQEKPETNARRFEAVKNLEMTRNEELTVNNDFSRGTAGWKGREGAKLEIVKEGNKNIIHVYSLSGSNSGLQQNFTGRIEKGKRYKAAFRVKYKNGPETTEFILCAKITYNGKEIYKDLIKGFVNKNEWASISGTFVIDQDIETIYLFIKTTPTGKQGKEKGLVDYYVDFVSVKEVLSTNKESEETAPNGSVLGLTWQWNHNPDNSKWSLLERKGFLRLRTCNVVEDLQQARNTLTQRTLGPKCSGWILMDVRNMNDGDYAGLAAFQKEYGFIGVTKQGNRFYVVMVEKGKEVAREELMQTMVYLKIDFDFEIDKAYFYYSYDGINWTKFGSDLAMIYTLPQHFMGYRFAIFNFATKKTGGYVDIDFFKFENKLTGTKTDNNWKVYLEESTISLDNTLDTKHDISVCVNSMPDNKEVKQIEVVLKHPEWLDVVGILKVDKLLEDATVKIVKRSENETAITIRDINKVLCDTDGMWKKLIKIQFRQKKKFNESIKEEISIKSFELLCEKEKISYGSDSAVTQVEYTAPNRPLGKIPPNANPLIAHKFGADPAVLVYKDRVYVYLTNDILEYDENGNIKDNTYSKINKITVISSDDLVNWTDHGEIEVAGPNGAAKWATQSWAPSIAYKKINGKDKFFLYFANNASGIGVLTSDSPIGPWKDPIGRPLISRFTPGVEGVVWLFDPAVLVDDDGKAYIYFGGGVPQGQDAMPNTARVMQLGDDMISVVGEAKTIPAPFMFEDSGINKINGVYYYSYCTNFYSGPRPQGSPPAGVIAYMTSKNPMGPWEYKGVILNNPGYFFGVGGNNHHQIFQFRGKWYIAYHAQTLAKDMGAAKGYRSPHINELYIEGNKIKEVIADYKGVNQIKFVDPYKTVEAETFAWCAGISTKKANASNNMCLTGIDSGDWIALSKVDFGNIGPKKFEAMVSNINGKGYVEIKIDSVDGRTIAVAEVQPQNSSSSQWVKVEAKVENVTGVHDLYFVFKGENGSNLFYMDCWRFVK